MPNKQPAPARRVCNALFVLLMSQLLLHKKIPAFLFVQSNRVFGGDYINIIILNIPPVSLTLIFCQTDRSLLLLDRKRQRRLPSGGGGGQKRAIIHNKRTTREKSLAPIEVPDEFSAAASCAAAAQLLLDQLRFMCPISQISEEEKSTF